MLIGSEVMKSGEIPEFLKRNPLGFPAGSDTDKSQEWFQVFGQSNYKNSYHYVRRIQELKLILCEEHQKYGLDY